MTPEQFMNTPYAQIRLAVPKSGGGKALTFFEPGDRALDPWFASMLEELLRAMPDESAWQDVADPESTRLIASRELSESEIARVHEIVAAAPGAAVEQRRSIRLLPRLLKEGGRPVTVDFFRPKDVHEDVLGDEESAVFSALWGVRMAVLPRNAAGTRKLNQASMDALCHTGLPKGVLFGRKPALERVAFGQLTGGLVPLSAVLLAGQAAPTVARRLLLLGFGSGPNDEARYWCVDADSGCIQIVDGDAQKKPTLVNADAGRFVLALNTFRGWVRTSQRTSVAVLRDSLMKIDPEAWPGSFWDALVCSLDEEGQGSVVCEGFE